MKVLICEDDIVVLKAIHVAFENQPVEVVSVKDGLMALEKLRDETFDLIITDIHMPFHNGDDIIKLVREEQGKSTPIIVISPPSTTTSKGYPATSPPLLAARE